MLASEVAPKAQASARPALQAATASAPAPLPAAAPEAVGLSPKGLARITELLQGYVDRKRVAGTVTMVLRDGKVAYASALGHADVEKAVPMRIHHLPHRVAVEGGPTVAAMILVDEGKLLLNDPSLEVPAGLHNH